MAFSAAAVSWRSRALLLTMTGLLAGSLPMRAVQAAESAAFVIPAGETDGYGIGDCMRSGSACGHVIADSWCEAHGHLKSVAFGSADDVTGSVGATQSAARGNVGDVVIRCGD